MIRRFSLRSLLFLMTLAAVLIAGVVYASRLDGLTLLIVVATLLTHVVLPASVIGTIVGIWRVNNRLAIVSGTTLGGVVGMFLGFLVAIALEYGLYLLHTVDLDWLSQQLMIEVLALVVMPTLTVLGIASGYWLTRRILERRV